LQNWANEIMRQTGRSRGWRDKSNRPFLMDRMVASAATGLQAAEFRPFQCGGCIDRRRGDDVAERHAEAEESRHCGNEVERRDGNSRRSENFAVANYDLFSLCFDSGWIALHQLDCRQRCHPLMS
jgi:hypothetical protein